MSEKTKENKVQQVVVKRRPGTNTMIEPDLLELFEKWMKTVNTHERYEVHYAR